jgi:hypothetical protein
VAFLRPYFMELPFQLHQPYELLEFSLEPLPYEHILMYDTYLYIGEPKTFQGQTPIRTELIYHWDILKVVILTFEKPKTNLSVNIATSNGIAVVTINTDDLYIVVYGDKQSVPLIFKTLFMS